jgi:hypothetical protein
LKMHILFAYAYAYSVGVSLTSCIGLPDYHAVKLTIGTIGWFRGVPPMLSRFPGDGIILIR